MLWIYINMNGTLASAVAPSVPLLQSRWGQGSSSLRNTTELAACSALLYGSQLLVNPWSPPLSGYMLCSVTIDFSRCEHCRLVQSIAEERFHLLGLPRP